MMHDADSCRTSSYEQCLPCLILFSQAVSTEKVKMEIVDKLVNDKLNVIAFALA